MTKLTWPAPERNKQPILAVLQRVLPEAGTLLELASGTGQHAAYFAEHLTGWTVQPSDVEPSNLESIRSRVAERTSPGLREPLVLDVCADDWHVAPVVAMYNANLVHIAPWTATLGLLRGAGRYLLSGGLLLVYGPFRIGGQHTAPSNQSFDLDLKQRDPRFGVRDLEAVVELAQEHGLELRERVEMPANNQMAIFAKRGGEPEQAVPPAAG